MRITGDAADPSKGMTATEVANMIGRARLTVPDDEPEPTMRVSAHVGFRGQVKSLTITTEKDET